MTDRKHTREQKLIFNFISKSTVSSSQGLDHGFNYTCSKYFNTYFGGSGRKKEESTFKAFSISSVNK